MFQRFKTFLNEIDDSIKLYLAILVICIAVVFRWFAVVPMEEGFGSNIRVEFFGFLFDLLIFGFGFSIFNQLNQRKQDIKRWQEEIDDYRGWDEKEATFRIIGNIKRLNRAKVTNIDLSYCFLNGVNLKNRNLSGADFSCSLLKNAIFWDARLYGAKFCSANLEGADFYGAYLEGANLSGANIKGAIFDNAFLEGAIVDSISWLKNLEKLQVGGHEELLENYQVVIEGRYFVLRKKI